MKTNKSREQVRSSESDHAEQFERLRDIQTLEERTNTIVNSIMGQVSSMNEWKAEIISAIYQQNTQVKNYAQMDLLSSRISEQAEHQWARIQSEKLVERLKFQEMFDRKSRISAAHRQTCEWIYAPPNPEQATWNSFVDWLEGENSLYWITGKPGSGKSTIMKYLYDNPRTMRHAYIWSQKAVVIKAGFFFWNSGTEMQMSNIGLMQTLLYQCLKAWPVTLSKVFPDRWRRCELFGDDLQPWTWEELSTALFAFCKTAADRYNILLFLDGLDEFQGSHQELIDLVRQLSNFPRVKVCASSRPWLVFEDAFKTGPNLMLQDLTIPDILNFVKDKLSSNHQFTELKVREPEYASNLELEIAKKSSGVFLWVHLVVESLLDGLTNSDRIIDLKRRLEMIPPDLDGFYDRILNSSDNFYFEHTSQLFRIFRKSQGSLNLLDFSFADEENPNASLEAPIKALPFKEKVYRCNATRRRINSRTKGLLDIPSLEHQKAEENHLQVPKGAQGSRSRSPSIQSGRGAMDPYENYSASELAWLKVEYLHRTVRDYLAKPEVWNRIVKGSPPPFNPSLCLAKACLLRLKDHSPDALSDVEYNIWSVAQRCAFYLSDAESAAGCSYPHLRRELARIAMELDIVPRPERAIERHHNVKIIRYGDRNSYVLRQLDPQWLRGISRGARRTPLSFEEQANFYERIRAQIEQGVLQPYDQTGRPLLTYALLDFEVFAILRLRLLRLLLESGADPNQTHLAFSVLTGQHPTCQFESTPWKDLLVQMESDIASQLPHQELYIESWVEVVELFLNYDVDRSAVKFVNNAYFEKLLAKWNLAKGQELDNRLGGNGIALSSPTERSSISKMKSRVSKIFGHHSKKSDLK